MSFKDLSVGELRAVAEFFVVDVESAKDEPTKKELLAALASGDDPVTWEQYTDIYLDAKANGLDKNAEVESQEEAVKKEAKPVEVIDTSKHVLVKYQRKNPTFEIVGYTFNKRHPFMAVPPEVAEYLVINVEGFRLALPSELADYYQ